MEICVFFLGRTLFSFNMWKYIYIYFFILKYHSTSATKQIDPMKTYLIEKLDPQWKRYLFTLSRVTVHFLVSSNKDMTYKFD